MRCCHTQPLQPLFPPHVHPILAPPPPRLSSAPHTWPHQRCGPRLSWFPHCAPPPAATRPPLLPHLLLPPLSGAQAWALFGVSRWALPDSSVVGRSTSLSPRPGWWIEAPQGQLLCLALCSALEVTEDKESTGESKGTAVAGDEARGGARASLMSQVRREAAGKPGGAHACTRQ